MIGGAIFDMDGTVLDSMPVWDELTAGFLARYGVTFTREDNENIEGCTQLEVAEYFAAKYTQLPLTAEQIVRGLDEMITLRYRELALPKAGAPAFLARLRAAGVKTAIATLTARCHAEKALRDLQMDGLFDFVLTIDDVGVSKYQPDIYLLAAEKMGCKVQDCMVFEDAPYAAETAKNAGFAVCGVMEKAYARGEALLRSVSDLVIEQSYDEITDIVCQ